MSSGTIHAGRRPSIAFSRSRHSSERPRWQNFRPRIVCGQNDSSFHPGIRCHFPLSLHWVDLGCIRRRVHYAVSGPKGKSSSPHERRCNASWSEDHLVARVRRNRCCLEDLSLIPQYLETSLTLPATCIDTLCSLSIRPLKVWRLDHDLVAWSGHTRRGLYHISWASDMDCPHPLRSPLVLV